MKVGDKIPVTIAGQTVTSATVKELGDGTVTLEFPATRAVMGVRTEIDTAPPAQTSGTEHAILGVENQPPATVAGNDTAAADNTQVNETTPVAEVPSTPAETSETPAPVTQE